ncbi:hypothetical protein FRB99_001467 [Tulasnella sp. 403]|nr:hypothetical protein FRB99_001467 [Tulasnella sp. 403]
MRLTSFLLAATTLVLAPPSVLCAPLASGKSTTPGELPPVELSRRSPSFPAGVRPLHPYGHDSHPEPRSAVKSEEVGVQGGQGGISIPPGKDWKRDDTSLGKHVEPKVALDISMSPTKPWNRRRDEDEETEKTDSDPAGGGGGMHMPPTKGWKKRQISSEDGEING